MPQGANTPRFLLELAAQGIAPIVGGCAGALVAGPVGAAGGASVGRVVEKAINFFGPKIVEKWVGWFRRRPNKEQVEAVAALATVTPQEAREVAGSILDQLVPDASSADRSVALEYLAAIPDVVQQSLVPDTNNSGMTVPPSLSLESPSSLIQLLPTEVPPYAAPMKLPDTDIYLKRVVGSGGFGVVYEAMMPVLQNLPLAIKFCLDTSMANLLKRERDNLERLQSLGGNQNWSPKIVRLYGSNLDYATPFLIYEYVPGGTLAGYVGKRRQETGGNVPVDEVFGLIRQITEGLAFAHERGLVHRDLKPANVLVDGKVLKLADFGIGGAVAGYAVTHSQIGQSVVNKLHADEQVSMIRGSGTPLYMDPDQRRGSDPQPRHDLYSLGVVWYQLLTGDVTRELHGGWDAELESEFAVPRPHIELIKKCVGWIKTRPAHAGELLKLLDTLTVPVKPGPVGKPEPDPEPEDSFVEDDVSDIDSMESFGKKSKHPKYAYLLGMTPKGKNVHWLVKVHDWDAKAVYLYDLTATDYTNIPRHIAGSKEPDELKKWMVRAKRDGHEIPHKSGTAVELAEEWVKYGKAQAAKRGFQIAKQPDPTSPPPAPGASANAAEQLFQRLLRERRKISYIRAYEILLGSRPDPWRNMPHCSEVLTVAKQSTPQVYAGLTIQLDALIVNQDGNQEPSDGYFNNRGFTREQWQAVFRDWLLL